MNDKPLGHYRLASAKLGDDCTLTRYVRTNRVDKPRPRKHQPRIPGLALAFVEEGRTKFGKSVKHVSEMRTLLVSGHSNVKIGRDVRKGHFRGYWIYTLSLEERKTCPSSCAHWSDCYGNNMPFAKRIRHDDPQFLPRLEREIEELLSARGRAGVLIRLHALGDFFSVKYVRFWERMLEEHPRLAIYGYTARLPGTEIGWAVHNMNVRNRRRSMVRFSDGGCATMSTLSIVAPEDRPADAFVCPEQTGQTQCCATCGACWGTAKNVAFLAH
jgi:hypothetical protein